MSEKARKVLFLDKALFTNKKRDSIHGAERFNLILLKELQACGLRVDVATASSWKAAIENISDAGGLKVIGLPFNPRIPWPNAVLSILNLAFKRYDFLLVGNIGNVMIPVILLLYYLGVFKKCVIMGHREPSAFFVKMLSKLPIHVIAVNKKISDHFEGVGRYRSDVYFGEIRSDIFKPAKEKLKKDDLIHFLVFGSLDCDWKGSDTAIEAFSSLPDKIRKKAKLHLAGFSKNKPDVDGESIVAYSWIDEAKVPEFIQSMDVLVIPSRDTDRMKETFCQALVQGMLCRLPVIVNNLPVLTDKVKTGGGLIFNSIEEFRDHFSLLVEDVELREKLAAEALEIARKDFLWNTEHFVNNYLQ